MYKQTLYKVVTPIKLNTIARLNKSKKWEYGYNKEHDVVVISKTGQIGEIYEIHYYINILILYEMVRFFRYLFIIS